MILRIKPRDDTASEDPITDPRVHNAERNRRCQTSQIDKHLSHRSSTCLFAIEIHPEDLEEAVIEHNPRYYSRLWRGTRMLEAGTSGPERVCPHSTFDYQRYRSLGPSRIRLLYDEMSADARDISDAAVFPQTQCYTRMSQRSARYKFINFKPARNIWTQKSELYFYKSSLMNSINIW